MLVVGGGPVGLTLAWRLTTLGIETKVLEKAAVISEQLRASTFHPPTLDLFEEAGITTELIAHGRITPTWQIRLHETAERAEFDLSVLHNDTNHPYRLQCHQAQLSRSLLNRLPKETVHFNSEVLAVGQGADDVWLRTETETFRADYLVGCDGARSLVRESIGAGFEGATYPDTTLLVTTRFPFQDYLADLSGVNYIWIADGTYSLLRLPDVWRISLHPMANQTPEQALQHESIRMQTKRILPDAPDLDIVQKRIYRVHHRLASKYRKGRMFLAGDAAHLNSPKGGMGLNGGIHDAFCLAELLASATGAMLDRYQRQRRVIAEDEIIAQSDANRKRMNTTDPQTRIRQLHSLQRIAENSQQCREFLLKSSMISGLRRARQIV